MQYRSLATLGAMAIVTVAQTGAVARTAPITPVTAAKIADDTIAAWLSQDAARIKAMYGDDLAAFDTSSPALVVDRSTWNKAQDEFATLGMDGATQRARKIQILSPDIFVMSGVWDVTNSAKPAYNAAIRCTLVYHRDAKGHWPIVAEQCSFSPKAG